jgi:hypothetical protein
MDTEVQTQAAKDNLRSLPKDHRGLAPVVASRSLMASYVRWLKAAPSRHRRRPNRHRARNIVLYGLLLLLGWQAYLAIIAVRAGHALADPVSHYRLKRFTTSGLSYPARWQVAALGSSRTLQGLNAPELEAISVADGATPTIVGNFAQPGGGPIIQLLHLRRLLQAGVRPDVVLVELTPFLLDERDPEELQEIRLPPERLTLEEAGWVAGLAGQARPSATMRWWQDVCFPQYTHRFALVSQVMPNLLPLTKRLNEGHAFLDMTQQCVNQHGQQWRPELRELGLQEARRRHFDKMQTIPKTGVSIEALDEIFRLCKQEGIRAALILMPEGREFQSWYSDQALADIQALAASLSERNGIAWHDCQNWLPDEHWYSDSHHLLPTGANKFTRRFWHEVLQPMLTNLRTTSPQRKQGKT